MSWSSSRPTTSATTCPPSSPPSTSISPRPTSWSSTTTRPTAPARSPMSSPPGTARSTCCTARQAGARHRLRRRLQVGARSRDYQFLFEMDCDFSHDPKYLPDHARPRPRRRRPGPRLALRRRRRHGQLGPDAQDHLARRLAVRPDHPRHRRARRDRRLQVLPPRHPRGARPRQRQRAGLRLSDRDDLSRHQAGLPRRGGAHHLRRPPRRPVQDVEEDLPRGADAGVEAALRRRRRRRPGAWREPRARSSGSTVLPSTPPWRACPSSIAASSTATRSTRSRAPLAASPSRSTSTSIASSARPRAWSCARRRARPSARRSSTRSPPPALDDAYVRIVVTRGAGEIALDPAAADEPRLIVIVRPPKPPPPEAYRDGVEVAIVGRTRYAPGVPTSTVDPQVKSGNYLGSVMAVAEARKRGAYEAILCDNVGPHHRGQLVQLLHRTRRLRLDAAPVGRPARGHHAPQGHAAPRRASTSAGPSRRCGRSICTRRTRRS